MSLFRALTITCDGKFRGGSCKQEMLGPVKLTNERALALAAAQGWSRVHGADYCRGCTERRAKAAKQARAA